MWDAITTWFTTYLNWFYYVPLAFCAIGVPLRFITVGRQDVVAPRARTEWVAPEPDPANPNAWRPNNTRPSYYPKLTVGYMVGRVILSVIPVANLWYAAFHILPFLLTDFLATLEKWFDKPLFPDKSSD